jgi:hypothetical protein
MISGFIVSFLESVIAAISALLAILRLICIDEDSMLPPGNIK